MSLIEEALRRVQGATTEPPRIEQPGSLASESFEAAEQQIRRVQVPVTRNRWGAFMWGMLVLSVLMMGLLTKLVHPARLAVEVRDPSTNSANSAALSRSTQATHVESLPALPFSKKPAVPKPPELQLNGVVEGVGEPFAIINGSIIRLGETIANATLVEIRSNSARLRRRNQELVLRTQH